MILPSELAAPTTRTAGYFRTSPSVLAGWLVDGLEPTWASRDAPAATLAELLALMRPRVPLSSYLLLPVGDWTVLLDDAPNGTDLGVLPWQATRDLGCRSVRATVVPDGPGQYPATVLELYDPDADEQLLWCRRSIAAANDGGRWTFSETGDRFSFEDPAAYQRRRVRDRFTPDLLARYLMELTVPADHEPDPHASIVVQHTG